MLYDARMPLPLHLLLSLFYPAQVSPRPLARRPVLTCDERTLQGNVAMVYLATPEGGDFMMGPLDKPAKERKVAQRRQKLVVSCRFLFPSCFGWDWVGGVGWGGVG